MQQLNRTFRGIDEPTDILSFDAQIPVKGAWYHAEHNTPYMPVLGDLLINAQKADDQARRTGLGFYDEVYRLMIHGVLHLLGYNHESPKESMRMEDKEQEIFHALKKTG
jgi:probable rRNA maturation factor